MRYALFIRHAEAVEGSLTQAGKYQASELGLRVAELGDVLHFGEWLIAVSCLKRAMETGVLMNEGIWMPLTVRRELAETEWANLETHAQAVIRKLESLSMAEGTTCVVVITHERGAWYLAQAALESAEKPIPSALSKASRTPEYASGFLVDLHHGGVRSFSWDEAP